jgi:hypothetical protein
MNWRAIGQLAGVATIVGTVVAVFALEDLTIEKKGTFFRSADLESRVMEQTKDRYTLNTVVASDYVPKAAVDKDYVPRTKAWPKPDETCEPADCLAFLGTGVGDDGVEPKRMVSLLARACFGGAWDGCHRLAELLQRTDGPLPQDALLEAGFNSYACNHAVWRSCVELAHAYQVGRGVAKEMHKADTLMQMACAQLGAGDPACQELHLIDSNPTQAASDSGARK